MESSTVKLAKILSYTFHPIFMASYGIFVILMTKADTQISYFYSKFSLSVIFFGLFFLQTAVLPILILGYLKYQKIIPDFQLSQSKDRHLPYLIILIVYGFFCYNVNNKFGHNSLTFKYLLIVFTGIIFNFIINFFIKISSHCIGIAGFCGLCWYLYFDLQNLSSFCIALVSTLIAGLVANSRIVLKSHSVLEINLGLAIGLFVSLCLNYIQF